jgi:hypothetical protein
VRAFLRTRGKFLEIQLIAIVAARVACLDCLSRITSMPAAGRRRTAHARFDVHPKVMTDSCPARFAAFPSCSTSVATVIHVTSR